ncbi:MAG: ABC transporter substrate-binding protein [Ardenticatenales bacterium]
MSRTATRVVRSLAATALFTSLAACGQATTVAPDPTAASVSESPTEGPEVGKTAADTLVFGHAEDATKLDPADVTDSESLLATWHIYEGLTRYKPGSTEVEPSLATEWSSSDDGLTWTFKLRGGVTFQDGTAFDADAVVWNFNRWFDASHPQHFSDWEFEYWKSMFQGLKDEKNDDGTPKSVFAAATAVDPQTVTITLNRPSAPLLQNLAMSNFAFSSPAAVEKAGDSYGTPNGTPIAVGTGPYMVSEWVKDDHLTLDANPTYWGDAPATAKIELRAVPDNTSRFLALQNGELDGMTQLNPDDIAAAKEDANLTLTLEPPNNVGYLGFNQAIAPWDNIDCRMAVAQAIDKAAIVTSMYAGDAEPAAEMMPPSLWGYNKTIVDYPFDMDAAKASLEKCTAKAKLPEKVQFYVMPVSRFYFPQPKELGEYIQAQLQELGVTTEIQSPDWGGKYLPDVRDGKADIFMLGWGGDNGDPDNFLCQFFCGAESSFNSKDGKAAPPDAALATLLKDAAATADPAKRAQMYEEANQKVHDGILAVPLVHRSPPIVFRSNVTGYTASPLQQMLTRVAK